MSLENEILNKILFFLGDALLAVWPLLAFFILLPMFASTWLFWRQELFKNSIKFVFLEIKIPREITKSPQAMEKVLDTIHALGNYANDLEEIWWIGEVTRWYSFEMVSFGGEIHYFLRVYYRQRRLVEAAFYSYYPDIELVEVEDYTSRFFNNVGEMDAAGYDLWGGELKLRKEDIYPIKSYKDFEAPDEEKQFDPMSVFLEVFSKVDKRESVAVQYNAFPIDLNWYKDKERNDLLEKMKEPKTKKEEGVKDEIASFARYIARSPGETDALKAVENNLSKRAYKVMIRFIYFSPKEIYYDSFARRGLISAFNQYAALDLNALAIRYEVSTRTKIWNFPYIFPKIRNNYRKQRILYAFKKRDIPKKTWMGKFITSFIFNWNFSTKTIVLNTESLATLYHLPTHGALTAPHVPRVESKRASPPAGMAIFGSEEEIEKFTK